MNLTLAHCWKEWRAQRGIVLGYTSLVVACLCLVFLSMPEAWCHSSHRGAISLSWFVAAGMLGVLLFVAPGLVRCEFGSKDDQFVRRLPGALGASCGGKVLFLALATAALPLVGLACGELFLSAIGQRFDEFVMTGTIVDEQGLRAQWPAVVCGYALLAAPWVWAVGTWLPRGRMSLGGAVLLAILLGFVVTLVFQQSPRIEKGLRWQPWLWYVPPAGLLVAVVSWTMGRRGGGALRSAKFGAMAFAIVAVPPAGWLGGEIWRYHHPDPRRFEDQSVSVSGITPDLRFAIVQGREEQMWQHAPFRIDLTNGDAQQIGSTFRLFTPELYRPTLATWRGTLRFWRSFDSDLSSNELFDLTTGARTPIEGRIVNEQGPRWSPILPPDHEPLVREERRLATPLRAPGGQRVWFDDRLLRFEGAGDLPWPNDPWPVLLQPAGHGFLWRTGEQKRTFDLVTRRPGRHLDHNEWCWFVRGSCVLSNPKRHWLFRDPDGPGTECAALQGAHVLGLFDDERLLCAGNAAVRRQSLFLFDVATQSVQDVPLPANVGLRRFSTVWPMDQTASLLARDPAGRIWLCAAIDDDNNRGNLSQTFVLLDTQTLATHAILPHTRYCRDSYDLLAWPDAHSALMKQGAQILRIDTETGERTVLFPRR